MIENILTILNLILLEIFLSIDNTTAISSIVQTALPLSLSSNEERAQALRYGILGAYLLRGLALFFVSLLKKLLWLKVLGGMYLCGLSYNFFNSQNNEKEDIEEQNVVITTEEKNKNRMKNIIQKIENIFGKFWSTVILIEIMDLVFSMDNIFACIAFTNELTLIWIGSCV